MREPTRPLPSLVPLPHGGWGVDSYMSSEDYTIRGLGLVPPNSVIPVIVVPGIMGSNLKAKRGPQFGQNAEERNKKVKPGQPTWRPPNGISEGLAVSLDWDDFTPTDRQLLLDPTTLEVDDEGPVVIPDPADGYVLTKQELRQRGWGEVHADSYGVLLSALQTRLNQTFEFDEHGKRRVVRQHWRDVIACRPEKWGVREFPVLTESHLVKHAQHYFPVYAVGYCWLLDCQNASELLEKRINSIIDSWKKAKRRCDKVILVTHSMGGLVARACAQRVPEKIAGVIHGVMPAMGAPVAYRRIACGTETRSPGANPLASFEAFMLAKILGQTTEKTTPVLATSPGALQLLPNHLYPHPWLHVRVMKSVGPARPAGYGVRDDVVRVKETPQDYLHLPNARIPNPYDIYRDFKSWYRLIDLAYADPAGKYKRKHGGIENAVKMAIASAEKFHKALGDYYHPNTYAFYGDDQDKLSYAEVRWTARQGAGSPNALTPSNVAAGKFIGQTVQGERRVIVEGKTELHFSPAPQDARGDGTVPFQSGSGVAGKVRQVFATRGYDHQYSYKSDDMVMLTLRLIVKIVQELP